MFGDTFAHTAREIQTPKIRIRMFEIVNHAQALAVVLKSALVGHEIVEHFLTPVAEGRMTQVVGESDRLDKILIKPKCPAHRPAYLGNFKRVRKPGAIMIVLVRDKNLRLEIKPSKCRAMDDPVTITLKSAAIGMLTLGVFSLLAQAY